MIAIVGTKILGVAIKIASSIPSPLKSPLVACPRLCFPFTKVELMTTFTVELALKNVACVLPSAPLKSNSPRPSPFTSSNTISPRVAEGTMSILGEAANASAPPGVVVVLLRYKPEAAPVFASRIPQSTSALPSPFMSPTNNDVAKLTPLLGLALLILVQAP